MLSVEESISCLFFELGLLMNNHEHTQHSALPCFLFHQHTGELRVLSLSWVFGKLQGFGKCFSPS